MADMKGALILLAVATTFYLLPTEGTTCADDPANILTGLPDSVNNCSKIFNLLGGNCDVDMSGYMQAGGIIPPYTPYPLSDLCCAKCASNETAAPPSSNTNVTGCDFYYCGEACHLFAYCLTDPDEMCVNAPPDCASRCYACDPCEDDPSNFLANLGGCEGLVAFVGGADNYCNTDLSVFDYTNLMQQNTYFGWMVCPTLCNTCPGGNFTSNHCLDDPMRILELFGDCETVATLIGSTQMFCQVDVSTFDEIGTIPSGTTGSMLCPKMCHGCNPTEAENVYTEIYGYKNMTLCAELGCTFLNLTENYDLADEPFLSNITSLRKIEMSHNNIQSLGTIFLRMVDMIDIDVSQNLLTTFEVDSFRGLQNLTTLDISWNRITAIPTASLSNMPSLLNLYLMYNRIHRIESFAFASSADSTSNAGTLIVLNIANQGFGGSDDDDSTVESLRLEENAFSGCCATGSNLALSRNRFSDIPSDAFSGLRNTYLNLRNLGVRRVEPKAFRGVQDVSIDLRGNNIQVMSVDAFDTALSLDSGRCTDYYGFSLEFSIIPGFENEYTCEGTASSMKELARFLYTLRSSDQNSVFDACCAFGGGNTHGQTIMIDSFSDVTCRVANESVKCGCGCEQCRYDLNSTSCKKSCTLGQRWEQLKNTTPSWLLEPNSSGTCRDCPPGTFGDATLWSETCQNCPAGLFNDAEGATACSKCDSNTYSIEGATSCSACPYGKSSRTGSSTCVTCSPMFIGSENCQIPVLGIALVLVSGFVLAVVGTIIVTWYRKENYLKESLLTEVAKQRRLLKAKCTDLSLMSMGWIFSPSQVRLDKKIAASAGAEVWKGSLNDRWIVAVKKVDRTRRRLVTSELQFMMRTRHERLVMFLGCCKLEDNTLFLLSEFMEGGSLDRLLWNDCEFPWLERLQILLDVAEGLAYLHLMHKSIHRDLKSPNVLLTLPESGGQRRAKIADFGSSRHVSRGKRLHKGVLKKMSTTPLPSSESEGAEPSTKTGGNGIPRQISNESTSSVISGFDSMSSEPAEWGKRSPRERINVAKAAAWSKNLMGFVGTAAWMAPEVMKIRATYGPAADVYSFGMLCWETCAREKPWKKYEHDIKTMFENVAEGKRPAVPSHGDIPSGFTELMQQCWAHDPVERPMIDFIRHRIQMLLCAQAQSQRKLLMKFDENRAALKSSKSFTLGSRKRSAAGSDGHVAPNTTRRFSSFLPSVRRASEGLLSKHRDSGAVAVEMSPLNSS